MATSAALAGGVLLNGGFEDEVLSAWEPFGGAPRLSRRPDARSGQYGLVFDLLPEDRPAWQGAVQAFSARAGDEVVASAWLMAVNPGANFSYLEVEFLDSERRPFGVNLKARSDKVGEEAGWTLREVASGVAPEGTAFAEVRLVVFGQNHNPEQKSHFIFDDVTLRPGGGAVPAAPAPASAATSAAKPAVVPAPVRVAAKPTRPPGSGFVIDDATGWTLFSSESLDPEARPRLVPAAARSGAFGLVLEVGGDTPGYAGAYHEAPVKAGATYTVRYHARAAGRATGGGSTGTMTIEWLDNYGEKLPGPPPVEWSSQTSDDSWEELIEKERAPADAVTMRLVFSLTAHDPGARARYLLDDVSITR